MTAPTDPLAFVLEAQQWNVVLAGLGELPWRVADPAIRAIAKQVNPPAEEAPGPPPAG